MSWSILAWTSPIGERHLPKLDLVEKSKSSSPHCSAPYLKCNKITKWPQKSFNAGAAIQRCTALNLYCPPTMSHKHKFGVQNLGTSIHNPNQSRSIDSVSGEGPTWPELPSLKHSIDTSLDGMLTPGNEHLSKPTSPLETRFSNLLPTKI